MNHPNADGEYTMGRSREETNRLIRQSQLYDGLTRRFLKNAGLVNGMRVLDIGSGAGDVALTVAELVGPRGQVVGVDVNGDILETARGRVEDAGLTNVEFVTGDARTLDIGRDFDALVGRFVLMYMADPAEALKQFASHLRAGGIVAFQEIDFTFGRLFSTPNNPLAEKLLGWAREVFERSGAHISMGSDLYRTFVDAGLPEPALEGTVLVGCSAEWAGYQYVADSINSVLPLLEEYGIATPEEADVTTLPERLQKEVEAAKSPAVLPLTITACARLRT